MINIESLFTISYGLYVVCAGDKEAGNGFISNSVMQVTAEPIQIAVCCHKNNYTTEFIEKYKNFSISVLKQDYTPEIMGRFGYRSGRDFDKLEGMDVEYGQLDTPVVKNDAISTMECKVLKILDMGTHNMYIGELVESKVLVENEPPLTYAYFRDVKAGKSPKNAPTYVAPEAEKQPAVEDAKEYKCSVCGYVYNEANGDEKGNIKAGTKFEDLPDNWLCPVCSVDKSNFRLLD
jgi:rubredoxin/flavin reductase (DIM6/NTAB) family NADH-FMN oxidoreductase RutF